MPDLTVRFYHLLRVAESRTEIPRDDVHESYGNGSLRLPRQLRATIPVMDTKKKKIRKEKRNCGDQLESLKVCADESCRLSCRVSGNSPKRRDGISGVSLASLDELAF